MNLYKSVMTAIIAAAASVGFTACDNNFDCPPVISPDLGGNGSWDATLTVQGAKAYYTAFYSDAPDTDKNYWVTGYIVGCVQTTETVFVANGQTVNMTGNFTSANNLLLAPTPDETDYENCIALQLPSGQVRSGLNLADNPGNLGRQVSVYGYIDKYLGLPGMRQIVNFNWGTQGIDTGEVETGKSEFTLASAITSGRCYALVANNTVANTVDGTNSFLKTSEVTIADGKFTANEKFGFLFTETSAGSGQYYITDYKGMFLYQDKYGNGWSNRPSAAKAPIKDNTGFLWQPEKNADGRWVISNVASARILAFDTQYTSYGIYQSLTEQYLAPELYEMSNDPVTVPDFTPSEGGGDSPDVNVGTGEGTQASPYDAVRAAAMAAAGSTAEVYVEGIISEIKEVSTDFGNASYYISPDGSTTDQFYIFRGSYLNGVKFTAASQIKVGDKVVIKGSLTTYNGTPQLGQGNQLVSLNGQGGSGGGDKPSDGAVYTGLVDNADGWTFDVTKLPEGAEYIWSWKTYNNSGYLNASAYIGGTANESIAYAFTSIDLTGYTSASATFEHAAKFQTTITTLGKVVVREQGSSAWTELDITTWPAAGSWTFVSAGSIDLSKFAGKKVDFGFKYASTTDGADTWEIKNLKVTAN